MDADHCRRRSRGASHAVRCHLVTSLASLIERTRRVGWKGVVRSGRRRLAEWVAPGPANPASPRQESAPPSETSPTAGPPAGAAPLSALAASHSQALEWFDRRRGNYVRLADALRPYLPRDGVLFDVGANIGYFTKVLAEELDFEGRAHLFEPIPHLASLCEETLGTLKFETTLHSYGLSDEDAWVDIYVANSGNLGWNTMVAGKTSAGMKPLSIEVRRFDEAEISVIPHVVKIDVEGAEYRVLAGMAAALERWSPKPTILCEIGWGTSHPHWEAELEAFASLLAMGYQPQTLSGEHVELATLTRTTDILFVHSRTDH
jgi:FkbM family methyltransferase